MFLPVTQDEAAARGWQKLDIILISADTYIDSPFIGISVIANVLADKGFKVGVIAQPDIHSGADIQRLGEPALFWGVSGGCVDSMVANTTPLKKKRKSDDFTPGGVNDRRPDRAVIVYTNLIRRYFKDTVPIVLGGIEASLRRIAHYDFWSNRIRRSVLLDAKADYLLYGMAHKSVVALAERLHAGTAIRDVPGLCYLSDTKKGIKLPDFDQVQNDKTAFSESFKIFYDNTDPITARPLCQRYGNRYLIVNPPPATDTEAQMDQIHDLDYARDVHPFYKKQGSVRALETIRFSIPVHHGCYGECNFCAISVHQGRTVRFRSRASIVREAAKIARLPGFKGYITDLGGPTANMYGYECKKKQHKGACRDKRCLFPDVCRTLQPDHGPYLELIREIEGLPGIKKVFISSGIRHDLIFADRRAGRRFIEKIVKQNVSGQMKVAPEHTQPHILELMGKPPLGDLLEFKAQFDAVSRQSNKKQFLTYYLIAAHPGCTLQDMQAVKQYARTRLNISPEQVQIFTPTPSTWSTLMYYTGQDPFTGSAIFVEKDPKKKEKQKQAVTPGNRTASPAAAARGSKGNIRKRRKR